ncbi:pyruvate, water dikinase regulatory protein [Vaginisenegalia massiliensis]|uniref:pyruvate, water dikinase regulatory protein n=1 Tax=Vaginisenegalia massiliensis TaxID=2058294 RepID=UPI000F52B598|nr:pyruvate, water dikinase regulatory protein [Vaginisenegalia massiliensis]
MNDLALTVFVISDSIGETAQRVIHAALAQFPNLENVEIHKFPYIKQVDELEAILQDAVTMKAMVVTTLVDYQLNIFAASFAQKNQLKYIDFMSPLLSMIQTQTQQEPLMKSGLIHKMDTDYFKRVEAIEFSVKYDDGKNISGLSKADIVVLGVSRTSKTPLSMYMANRSFKVANVPLIPELNLPKELYQIPSHKIIGLTASPKYIMNIRGERIKMLGLNESTNYNDLDRIKAELSFAEDLYAELGAFVINVENKSIEETAQQIEHHLKHS